MASLELRDQEFYLSLHQKKQEQSLCRADTTLSSNCDSPDFTGTEWDLMRSSAMDIQVDTRSPGTKCWTIFQS